MGGNVTQAEVKESAKVLRLETDGHIWGTEKDRALKFHSTDPYARSTIYELCDLGKFLSPSELLFLLQENGDHPCSYLTERL